jgi:hypothetical protein
LPATGDNSAAGRRPGAQPGAPADGTAGAAAPQRRARAPEPFRLPFFFPNFFR